MITRERQLTPTVKGAQLLKNYYKILILVGVFYGLPAAIFFLSRALFGP